MDSFCKPMALVLLWLIAMAQVSSCTSMMSAQAQLAGIGTAIAIKSCGGAYD